MTIQDPRATQGWRPPHVDGPVKTLLIAEDERATQNLCRIGLRGLAGFKILVASNGAEALEVMRQETVNVLVTDLNMPVMDGFNLIALVTERYPHIPVLVITSMQEEEHQNVPLCLGALRILPKPVRLPLLMEEIRSVILREPDGMVKGITLTSLLQLMEWEKKNATLNVEGKEGVGLIYVSGGQLIHAAYRDLEGIEAAYQILVWERPHIEFMETCKVQRTIDMPMAEVLLNAAFLKDTTLGGPR
ncbi:MAG: response regulator [Holophaga sp.]|nr:response regulator [Holophaga sp.]